MLHLDGRQARTPAALAEQIMHAHRSPRGVVGDAHVPGAPGGDGQAQCVGRLLQGGAGIGHLDQQEVQVIGAQAGQAGVERVQQRAAGGVSHRGPLPGSPGAHPGLGDQDEVLAIHVLAQEHADHLLADALAVGGGGVHERAPGIEEDVELFLGLELIGVPAPGHRAQAHGGHTQAGPAESPVLHRPNRSGSTYLRTVMVQAASPVRSNSVTV